MGWRSVGRVGGTGCGGGISRLGKGKKMGWMVSRWGGVKPLSSPHIIIAA